MNNIIVKEFPVIETDRLILRKLKEEDSKDLFEVFSSEEVMKYYGMFPYSNESEAETLICNFGKSFDEDRSIRWGIELKDEGVLIGTCGFHNWNKTHMRAEIGYELNSKYWRKGYISEAIGKILFYGFDSMNLNRVEAVVYPDNIPSQLSLEKLGFEKEGLLREYAYFRGNSQDLIMYSLLRSQYK